MTSTEITIIHGDRSMNDNGVINWDDYFIKKQLLTGSGLNTKSVRGELHRQLDSMIDLLIEDMKNS